MVSLGNRFQLARKRQNITVEQASKALKIRVEFLHALENGQYNKLPSSAYAQGFVGNYAQFLGLSKDETIAMFRREFDGKNVYSVLPHGVTHTKEFTVKKMRLQQTFFVIAAIFVIMGGYIIYQYRSAFFSPQLDIYTPKENEIIRSNEAQVSGKSDPNATVFVNNSTVSLDKDGNFSKRIDLFNGKTVIEVSATNRFGRKSSIRLPIEVKSE
ncbi:MAG: helix-turn-helix domain-containing protein [Candidatus Levybacteria bacterium]|nr:helix-turn-helix domain-containing protein [Candidatus Levybacteria bacterium]